MVQDAAGWVMLVVGLVFIGLAIWGFVYYSKLAADAKKANTWIAVLSALGMVLGLIMAGVGIWRLSRHHMVAARTLMRSVRQ
jgi:uncharacterized membrane protein